jgi:hypothetical protein
MKRDAEGEGAAKADGETGGEDGAASCSWYEGNAAGLGNAAWDARAVASSESVLDSRMRTRAARLLKYPWLQPS